MNVNKQRIPLKKDLWSEPSADGKVFLLGSKCKNCKEIFFPKKQEGAVCTYCQHDEFDEITLSDKGKIYTYSVVMIRPPGGYYNGEVPYALGVIDLPEGVKVETLLAECDFEKLRVDMEVEMFLDVLQEDEAGNEIVCYKFRPVKGQKGA